MYERIKIYEIDAISEADARRDCKNLSRAKLMDLAILAIADSHKPMLAHNTMAHHVNFLQRVVEHQQELFERLIKGEIDVAELKQQRMLLDPKTGNADLVGENETQ